MTSVGYRPGAAGEVIENSIVWATAVPPEPDLSPEWHLEPLS